MNNGTKLPAETVGIEEAARRLNLSPSRVRALINDPCPKCAPAPVVVAQNGRYTETETPINPEGCPACFYTGRRLPARRLSERGAWLIYVAGLALEWVKTRYPAGRGSASRLASMREIGGGDG